jgi:hypothetical protein
MPAARQSLTPAASHRLRTAAQELCTAVEARMDELIRLVEQETALVREGKLFALKDLEPRKKRAAREFITGLEAVKRIRASLERHAPDTIYRLRRRHSEFRAMLQLSLAALATARDASEEVLKDIAAGRPGARSHEETAAFRSYVD